MTVTCALWISSGQFGLWKIPCPPRPRQRICWPQESDQWLSSKSICQSQFCKWRAKLAFSIVKGKSPSNPVIIPVRNARSWTDLIKWSNKNKQIYPNLKLLPVYLPPRSLRFNTLPIDTPYNIVSNPTWNTEFQTEIPKQWKWNVIPQCWIFEWYSL